MSDETADQQETAESEHYRRDERTCNEQSGPTLPPVKFMHERLDMGLRGDHPERLIELRFGVQSSSVGILLGVVPHAASEIVQTYIYRRPRALAPVRPASRALMPRCSLPCGRTR